VPHRAIRTQRDLDDAVKLLAALKLPFRLQWADGLDRSLEQNKLQFKWANEAAQQRGDCTFEEVRSEWKLRHGVPIRRRDDAEFCEVYDAILKPLSYADKLRLMPMFTVTSEMTTPQMQEYLDTINRECAEQGIRLTQPEGAT
jgi:hypothetical protein